LFIYIYRASFGFLSAVRPSGQAAPADGVYKNHLSYSTFSKWFKRAAECLAQRRSAFATDSGMPRKTAYKSSPFKVLEIVLTLRHVNDNDAVLQYDRGARWNLLYIIGENRKIVSTHTGRLQ
jgi:hypothetical protein